MQWDTVVLSLVSSSAVAGLAVFTLKRVIEQRVKLEYEQRLRKFDAELSIRTDLLKQITTEQATVYKRATSLVYRIRNGCRDYPAQASSAPDDTDTLTDVSKQLSELIVLLYDNMAVMHPRFYSGVHDFKDVVQRAIMYEHFRKERAFHEKGVPREPPQFDDWCAEFARIDVCYKNVVLTVRRFFGTETSDEWCGSSEP